MSVVPGNGGLKPGEAYRPFNLFNGAIIPYSLAARRDIGPGPKLLFGELAALMGRSGYCHPSVDHLAGRLGASADQITRWLRDLTRARLIKSRRRGPGSSAERVFVWHPWLAGSLKTGAYLETARIPVQATTETAKTLGLKPQKPGSEPGNLRVHLREEEVLRGGSVEEVLLSASHTHIVCASPAERFSLWFSGYQGRKADPNGAARIWNSVVMPETVDAAFACRDRYNASDEVSRGICMEAKKFISIQARNGWRGTWPPPTPRQETASERRHRQVMANLKALDAMEKRYRR